MVTYKHLLKKWESWSSIEASILPALSRAYNGYIK